jgi:hypothetical protein
VRLHLSRHPTPYLLLIELERFDNVEEVEIER